MQVTRIIDQVERKIQDSSYSRDDILDILNMGLEHITSSVVLPGLLKNDTLTLTAGSFSVSVPNDFFSHLLWAHNTTKDRNITVYQDYASFLELYRGLNNTGDVEALCEYGRFIYYQLCPATDQETRIWYSESPTLYTADDATELDYIPKHLQARLLVNYAAMYIFSEIESDEKDQPETIKYSTYFNQAMGALIDFAGLPLEAPQFVININDPWSPSYHIQTEEI